jgi:antitoxin HicB
VPRTKSEYPILLRKLSEAEGGGYLAEFPDLPGCMADGATPEEALLESQGALKSYLASAKKHADKLPAPTESVWRQRAPKAYTIACRYIQAEREGVSFNTLVISMLSEGLGRKTQIQSAVGHSGRAPKWQSGSNRARERAGTLAADPGFAVNTLSHARCGGLLLREHHRAAYCRRRKADINANTRNRREMG